MKKILFVLLMLASAVAWGQSSGYFRYDTVVFQKIGGNSELKILNATRGVTNGVLTNMGNGRTAFVTPASSTKAKSGTTLSGDTVLLGGTTLDRYSAIGLNGFPLNIIHNGVNNAAQADSNSLKFVNNTTAATISDSLVTPALLFSVKSKPIVGSSQPVNFRIYERGQTGSSTGGAHLVITSNINNGAYTKIFTISNLGVIQDNLNLFGHNIGNAGAGTNSIRFGAGALNFTNNSSVTGGNNIAIGNLSMGSTTSGAQNVAVGSNTLQSSITGTDNVAIGQSALALNTADFNTAVGSFALSINSSGHSNTAIGKNALAFNTTGIKNTSVGAGSGEATTGGFNNWFGEDAGLQNTTGTDNVGIGWLGWSQNRTGNFNVGVGNSTGRSILNGNKNVFIGAEAGYLDTAAINSQNDTLDNSIAIGYRAYTTASNQIWIGNGSHNDLRLEGITSGAGTKSLTYDPTTKKVTYDNTPGGGGGSQTPWTSNINADGFTLNGNDGSGESLTLGSTSHATKGSINFGTVAKVDEANNWIIANAANTNKLYLGEASGYPLMGFGSSAPTISTYAFLGDVAGGGTILNGQTYLSLRANNSEVAKVTSAGLGIGTTASVPLHVLSTTEQMRVAYDGSNYYSTTVTSAGAVSYDATGSAPSFDFKDRVHLISGSGTANVGGSLNSQFADVGNVGGGEDDLMTFSVPASTLSVNGDYLEFEGAVQFTAASSKTLKVYFGAQQILSTNNSGTSVAFFTIKGTIVRTGAATQRCNIQLVSSSASYNSTSEYTTAAETLSGAVTLKFTGTATSNNDIVQHLMTVKYYPAN